MCVENLVYTPTLDNLNNFFGGDIDDVDVNEYLQPHIMEMELRLTFEPNQEFAAKIADSLHATTVDLWFPKKIFCYDVDRALFEYPPAGQ